MPKTAGFFHCPKCGKLHATDPTKYDFTCTCGEVIDQSQFIAKEAMDLLGKKDV